MDQFSATQWWARAYTQTPLSVMRRVQSLVCTHDTELSQAFCEGLDLGGAVSPGKAVPAQTELAGMTVAIALVPSIARWLAFLFDETNRINSEAARHVQTQLAHMLADAGVDSVGMVSAFHRMKRAMAVPLRTLSQEPAEVVQAQAYTFQLIDLALEAVLAALSALPDSVRSPSLPRAVLEAADGAQSSDSLLERERLAQLSVLTEEENRYLRSVLEFGHQPDVKLLGSSVFGVWFRQRAPMLFEGSAEHADLESISATLSHLDGSVLPRLGEALAVGGGRNEQTALVREALADIADIRQRINTMFDRLARADGYRDALTQLFNRPFLPTILKREIEVARRRQSQFSVVVLHLANLTDVAADHGQETGDRLLQHVATVLSNHVRATDYVFRYSGEAFLILFAELGVEDSRQVAEKILRTVAQSATGDVSPDGVHLRLNLGLAAFDGDPDPQVLTDRADQALSQALAAGPNRIGVAH